MSKESYIAESEALNKLFNNMLRTFLSAKAMTVESLNF